MTEFGLVPVSWQREGAKLSFELTVPKGVSATLRLAEGDLSTLSVDGAAVAGEQQGRYVALKLEPGAHAGNIVQHPRH